MSKLLSARDLLDLVRQGQVEETGDAETVTAGTLGRKVYRGSNARTQQRHPQSRPAAPRAAGAAATADPLRGPRNTQLLEPVRKPDARAQAREDWSARPADPAVERDTPILRDARPGLCPRPYPRGIVPPP